MAGQQYSQYPAGQAGSSYSSYTGNSSYSQSGYGSTNAEAYTVESRLLQLSREKSAIQTQLGEVLKKYEVAVAVISIDQRTLSEQNQQIAELKQMLKDQVQFESSVLQLSREQSANQSQLEAEVLIKYEVAAAVMSLDEKAILEQNKQIAELRQMLKDQLSEVCHKFENLAGQSEDAHKVCRLDGKERDLESKLNLELSTQSRLEVESRFLQLSREKSAIQTQLEDILKKYGAAVAMVSENEAVLSEQREEIADLETEKQILKDQLSEVSHKFEHLAGQSEDTHKVHRLDGKEKDLESKLELEQTTQSHLENCTICFEVCTSSSEHSLVSLRCGHLFGRSCISRWLEGENARCPQCNARARKAEIINIYAKSLKVLDTSEHDKALEDLEGEVAARRNAEKTAAEERIKHGLAVQECERLKKELMDAQKQLQEYRSRRRLRSSLAAANIKAGFSPVHSMNMSKDGGCMLLVTQPSPFPNYSTGIKRTRRLC